jgi:hypothetical protein
MKIVNILPALALAGAAVSLPVKNGLAPRVPGNDWLKHIAADGGGGAETDGTRVTKREMAERGFIMVDGIPDDPGASK